MGMLCCFAPSSDEAPLPAAAVAGRSKTAATPPPNDRSSHSVVAHVALSKLPAEKTPPVAVEAAGAVDAASDGTFRALNAAEAVAVQEALLKVSALIGQFAEGRNEHATPIQLLRRAVTLVIADCHAAYGTMHLLPEAQDCALLVAAIGVPDSLVLHESSRLPQLAGSGSSIEQLVSSGSDYICWTSGAPPKQAPLPNDWAALVQAVGLRWIAAVPIRMNNVVLGVLTIGFRGDTDEQADAIWPTYLKLVAASMSSMVRDSVMTKYLTMVQDVHASRDLDGALQRVMHNLRAILGGQQMWYRLALTNTNNLQAVMFDDLSQVPTALAPRLHMAGSGFANAGGNASNGGSPAGSGHSSMSNIRGIMSTAEQSPTGMLRTGVLLKNAIMKISVSHRQQVIIPDVQKLINQSGSVAADLFSTRLLKPPTSVLVFPLKVRAHIFGVVYCMSAVLTDFADLAPRLREVSDLMAPHLLVMLATDLGAEYRALDSVLAAGSSAAGGANSSGVLAPQPSSTNLSRNNSQMMMANGSSHQQEWPASSHGSEEGFLAEVRSSSSEHFYGQYSRSSTGALVTGITEKLNQKRIRSAMDAPGSSTLGDLCVTELLGEGGFAKVFLGTWRGLAVGVKVVLCSEDETSGALMKNAHEIAILSALSHPNLIQAYACMTDVGVQDFMSQCCHSASHALAATPAFTFLQQAALMDGRMCHVEVIEYCDMGNLSDALKSGIFLLLPPAPPASLLTRSGSSTGRTASPPPGPANTAFNSNNMRTLLLTLIEIASGMSHLQRMGVVHCDLKPANVLLRSSNSDVRGFNTKVSDFGLSRVQDDDLCASFPFNSCGTAAYVAPEALVTNKRVDASVDVYAYGILMWEVYTRQKPYGSMKQQQLVHEVVMRGLRPMFPTHAPSSFVTLAQACWAANKDDRPNFDEVLSLLHGMLQAHYEVTAGGAGSQACSSSGALSNANSSRADMASLRDVNVVVADGKAAPLS